MGKIMLHICCGPCATVPIEELKREGEVVGVFVNPNIHPREEYDKRLENARRLAADAGVRLIEVPYAPEEWYKAVAGLENEPEGGARCETCFKVRLEKAVEIAEAEGFEEITTTLTIAPMKNTNKINNIGREVVEGKNIRFRDDDFKANDGFKRSIARSKELGLYRQNYCGCRFSLEERNNRKGKTSPRTRG